VFILFLSPASEAAVGRRAAAPDRPDGNFRTPHRSARLVPAAPFAPSGASYPAVLSYRWLGCSWPPRCDQAMRDRDSYGTTPPPLGPGCESARGNRLTHMNRGSLNQFVMGLDIWHVFTGQPRAITLLKGKGPGLWVSPSRGLINVPRFPGWLVPEYSDRVGRGPSGRDRRRVRKDGVRVPTPQFTCGVVCWRVTSLPSSFSWPWAL